MPDPKVPSEESKSTVTNMGLLERLAFLETQIGHCRDLLEDRQSDINAGPASKTSASQVRQFIAARMARDQLLGTSLFSDPAWDMLVEAFACQIEGVRLTISELCARCSAPETTALRWLKKLEEVSLMMRQSDPIDRRRTYLVLTADAIKGLDRYFELLTSASETPSQLDAM